MIAACTLLPALCRTAGAEIYADVALRQGATPLGTVRIELDAARAPRPVANFIGLATGQFPWINPANGMLMRDTPYYDGLIFHRLIHNFMIQGGDPTGTGQQGPGYIFQDQFHPDLRHSPYRVSMAHSGPNTNGSQFFIMLADAPWLDNHHSVFGVVNDPASRALIDGFKDNVSFETGPSARPLTDIVIDSVVIGGEGLEQFDLFDPALRLPRVNGTAASLARDTSDPSTTSIRGEWPAAYLHEYALGFTADPGSWGPTQNFLLIMNDDETATVALPTPSPNAGRFLRVSSVDYSPVPVAPVDLFIPNAVLTMALHGGELVVTFGTGEPTDVGSWTYTAADHTVTSGDLAAASPGSYDLVDLPVYPDGEAPLVNAGGLLRYLSVRALFLSFNQPVGPYNVRDIEAHVSFHTPNSGWINDDWYNSDVATGPAQFIRGPFTWTPPD